jgi:hypothetical protein
MLTSECYLDPMILDKLMLITVHKSQMHISNRETASMGAR